MQSLRLVILTGASFAALASTALAGGFAIREQSAEGQGMSFAGVAAGTNGLSSMFWNPATTSQHNEYGFISESNVALVLPYAEAEDGGPAAPLPPFNDSGNIGEWAVVPASYWVYGVNDRLTLGASMTAPFGLTTDANDAWFGTWHGDKSAVKTYNFSPNASYKVNDWMSIGVGAQIEYMTVDLTSRIGGVGTQILDADADSLGVGLTAGLLFEPTAATDIGIGFRSSIKHNLKGDGNLGPLLVPVNLSADYSSPGTVTIGIRHQLNEQLTLMGGVEWSNWSRFEDLTLVNRDTGAIVGQTIEDWNDGWFFSVGAEYAYSDTLKLRGGLAYEISPVPDATRTPRSPDNDRYWASIGASYRFTDQMTAHLSYTHVFIKDGSVDLAATPSAPTPLVATFEQNVDIISVGLTRDW
jgi:long-chain fatty acid transport protein